MGRARPDVPALGRRSCALKQLRTKDVFHNITDGGQYVPTNSVKYRKRYVRQRDDDSEIYECRDTLASQNPVVNLHHVERRGQIAEIEKKGEECHPA